MALSLSMRRMRMRMRKSNKEHDLNRKTVFLLLDVPTPDSHAGLERKSANSRHKLGERISADAARSHSHGPR